MKHVRLLFFILFHPVAYFRRRREDRKIFAAVYAACLGYGLSRSDALNFGSVAVLMAHSGKSSGGAIAYAKRLARCQRAKNFAVMAHGVNLALHRCRKLHLLSLPSPHPAGEKAH